jgi:hypothetical protein
MKVLVPSPNKLYRVFKYSIIAQRSSSVRRATMTRAVAKFVPGVGVAGDVGA